MCTALTSSGRFSRKPAKEKGYTQDEFAEIIGASHATLSALENGKGVSSQTLMRAISDLGLKLVVLPKGAQAEVHDAPASVVSASALRAKKGVTVNSDASLMVRLGGRKDWATGSHEERRSFRVLGRDGLGASLFAPALNGALRARGTLRCPADIFLVLGALPEDARLDELQRFYGVAEGDYFGLLAQIGWECAGAVEVMPSEDWALAACEPGAAAREAIDSRGTVGRLAAIAVRHLHR